MSGGNLSGVYHFYTMAVTAATMVYIYILICLWTKPKIESYFSDRLTFSNICGRTSR